MQAAGSEVSKINVRISLGIGEKDISFPFAVGQVNPESINALFV